MFSTAYAGVYDALYGDKDYDGECDLVEEAFRRFGQGQVRSILDLGCGTGNHAVRLARRGYEVVGVDRSPAMLAHARAKAEREGVQVPWREGDVRSLVLGRRFDAVLLMFAVLSYQLRNDDVLATLRTARRHLEPGGLLVFDVWHGPGVLTNPPGERTKHVDGVRRHGSAELDARMHLCCVRYQVSREGTESEETHVVRFFFPLEVELFLELSGFAPLVLAPFGALDEELDERVWNLGVVGRAV